MTISEKEQIKELEKEVKDLKIKLLNRIHWTNCLICKEPVDNSQGKLTLLSMDKVTAKKTTIGHLHNKCWEKLKHVN